MFFFCQQTRVSSAMLCHFSFEWWLLIAIIAQDYVRELGLLYIDCAGSSSWYGAMPQTRARVEQNGTHSKTQLHPILFSQIFRSSFRSLPIFSWYSQVCLKSGGRKNMLVYGLPFGAGKAACMDITLWNGVVSMLPCSLEICLPLPLKKIWPLVALVSFYTKSLGKPWSNSGGLHAFLWEVCAHRHLLQVAASVVPADEEANGTVVGHVIMLPVRVPPRLDWDPDIWGWRPFPLCKATTLLYWHAPFSWDLPITGNMFYPLAIVSNKLIIETSRWPASQSRPCPAICFTVQALRSVGAPSAAM